MPKTLLVLGLSALLMACGGEVPTPAERGPSSSDDGAALQPADRQSALPAGASPVEGIVPVVLFLGNSLTAGLGLTEDEAFPARVQQKMDSAGLAYRAVNAGVSGETSAGGVRRIDWLLRQPVAVLVLELGPNDALRGHDLDQTRRNLQQIVDRTRASYPDVDVVIAGMQAPPNLGNAYTEEFRKMFIELAEENDAALIPFLLEGVAAVPDLNQPDRIHPTAEGQQILAENVWKVLEPVLRRRTARTG